MGGGSRRGLGGGRFGRVGWGGVQVGRIGVVGGGGIQVGLIGMFGGGGGTGSSYLPLPSL